MSQINKIPQITCSLFPVTYMIFSFNYTFEKQAGQRIKIYFVNYRGIYIPPILTIAAPCTINIVGAQMQIQAFPVKYGIEYKYGRRVMWVEFVDKTYLLDNYYIALTGTACGFNIFQLGTSVNTLTNTQQINQALDPINQQIKLFTQFVDIEYSFNDFLNVLKSVFSVQITAVFDNTLTKSWVGTFREILNKFCSFYGLSWYYENNVLNIVDPTKLALPFPPSSPSFNFSAVPSDVIDFTYEESLEDTYGVTVSNWYQQEGGEFGLNGAGSNLITSATMYPVGQNLNGLNSITSEIDQSVNAILGDISNINNPSVNNAAQIIPNPNQVAAALYGKNFWFLYNYFNGTASSECGWTPIATSNLTNSNGQPVKVISALNSAQFSVAVLNEDYFEQKYQSYVDFANNIAGRYYVSNEVLNIDEMRTFQWYNISNGEIFDFTTQQADALKIDMQYALSQNGGVQVIPDTNINQYYDGIKYVGNVMYYKDTTFPSLSQFVLDDVTASVVNAYVKILQGGAEGTNAIDFSELNQTQGLPKYVAYRDVQNGIDPGAVAGYNNPPAGLSSAPTSIAGYFQNLPTIIAAMQPQFEIFNAVGVKSADVKNLKEINNLPSTININVQNNVGSSLPTIISNSSILRFPKNGSYVVYLDKISNCVSVSTQGNYFKRIFKTKNISSDIPKPQVLKISNNSTQPQYQINRDLSYVNKQMDKSLMNALATPRGFNTVELTYKFNYINTSLLNAKPISNGLVSLDIDVGDSSVQTTYKFSNEVLRVPDDDNNSSLEKLELQLKNSWIRSYNPYPVFTTANDAT